MGVRWCWKVINMASHGFFAKIIVVLCLAFITLYTTTIRWKYVNKLFHQPDNDLQFYENAEFHHLLNKIQDVDCALLFKGKANMDPRLKERLDRDVKAFDGSKLNLNVTRFIQDAKEKTVKVYCQEFKRHRDYVTQPLTQEEAKFPIAYSIVVYKDAEMFERLLRAIYRPQNTYCISLDHSSTPEVQAVVRAVAECFDNVFLPVQLVDVVWGEYSVLEAELVCMEELLLKYKKWKYFINLTGQEFPLKSNMALVKILRAYNGANNLEGTIKGRNMDRYEKALPIPVNVSLTKGSIHIVVSRAYVDYVINNDTAKQFLTWVKSTKIPDETYFSSLNHSPHLRVPGSYLGKPETNLKTYPFLTRFKNWGEYPCGGKWFNSICIFGIEDLPLLASRKELFANKFHSDYQTAAYACMEELILSRTRNEVQGVEQFNTSYYEQQDFVIHHI